MDNLPQRILEQGGAGSNPVVPTSIYKERPSKGSLFLFVLRSKSAQFARCLVIIMTIMVQYQEITDNKQGYRVESAMAFVIFRGGLETCEESSTTKH